MRGKIYRAGVIPYYKNNEGEIEFIFMKPSDAKYGGPDFQIAKGKIEDYDTSVREAGIREGEEELGLKLRNIARVWKLGVYLGRTTIYVAEILHKDDFGDTCSETSETTWMTEEMFAREGRPLHIHIVREALSSIHDV